LKYHTTLSCLFLFCECRNLIAERSRGEPIQSARSKGKRNKKADAAPGRMRTVVELSSVPYGKAGSSIYNGA
jgi:hypothetical protein